MHGAAVSNNGGLELVSQAQMELQQKQIRQAEELLFSGPEKAGFCKDLFFGKFRSSSIFPYPQLPAAQRAIGDEWVAKVRRFADEHIDADAIDRHADIPLEVIRGLGEIGVLGATISPEYGGAGMSQQNYCRVMEVFGARCGSTTVFVNAHHSIGLRALELFGTKQQKDRWMPLLMTGEHIAAFALTEPEAGSDASNVRTTATPTADGSGFVLNGVKRYITNGGIAQVLTVMARTPDPKDPDGKITAFIVTPDMPGFEVVEERMEKVGIRGTATGRLAFHDMFVPRENILGELGRGLKIALTTLDFGRTTFGASCTGAAKFLLEKAVEHANRRKQFGRTLGEFELVREKIALAAADAYAMEAATYHTAALIDSGAEDYMMETAMLKVFASDQLWRIVNDTLQIYGGAGFFTDQPIERMMRDARLNLIGEGANDVLRSFICMVGVRHLGKQMEGILKQPWKAYQLYRPTPEVPVTHGRLQPAAAALARQVGRFARAVRNMLIRHREGLLEKQMLQGRLGDAATELFMASCVYSRLTSLLSSADGEDAGRERELETGLYYLQVADRRNAARLHALKHNDDDAMNRTAELWRASSM
ncbi:MAG: acyl-CoA dehydrogenase family protein [Planctomycetales bacterium]